MSSTGTLYTFTGPISTVAYRLAEKWSRDQATPEKSQQVLLNSLSVFFVKFYLECMGFEIDTDVSDSWNPVQQTLMDVADLSIKNLGKLECRPVLKNSQVVYIPPEVQSNRIGYVAVQISESLQSAKLLGFIKNVSGDNLPINSLQPLENLLEYLKSIEESLEVTDATLPSQNVVNLINLKRWFDNIFESGWSSIESIIFTEPVWQFRSASEGFVNSVERAKLLDFGIEANRVSVGIVVKVNRDESNDNEFNIIVELHPTNGQEYLPPMLDVMILDCEETALLSAKAKNDNKKIELEFGASAGDAFSIKIAMDDISVIENFIV
ncbi:hypothetical protein RIVM261_070220 [Rivularia sp. IAM M-261]|nr:hypothetical protein RIVM261_070220 [Rivularia sp. IAM M-261]